MEDVAAIVYLSILVMNLSIYKQHAMQWRILVVCIEGGGVADCNSVDEYTNLVRKAEECCPRLTRGHRGGERVKPSQIMLEMTSDLKQCRLWDVISLGTRGVKKKFGAH